MLDQASLIILAISSFITVAFAPRELRVAIFMIVASIIAFAATVYFFSFIALPVTSFIILCFAVNVIRKRLFDDV